MARRRGRADEFGAVFDIAGDRVVEMTFWIVFAHLGVIPVWIPLAMITRGFMIDAMRSLGLKEGKTAFGKNSMMRSPITQWLTGSRFMRAFYGVAKVLAFAFLAGLFGARLPHTNGFLSWYDTVGGADRDVVLRLQRGRPLLRPRPAGRLRLVGLPARRGAGAAADARPLQAKSGEPHHRRRARDRPAGGVRWLTNPPTAYAPNPSNLPAAVETTVPLVGNRAVVEATEIAVVPQADERRRRPIGAVFDVDRTLLPGTTAERLFLRYLWEKRELGLREALLTAGFTLRHLRPTPSRIVQSIRRHRPYLRGKDLAEMQQLGADCFARDIRPRLAARGIEAVAAHRAQGHTTVMLSGSLWFLLQPMAEFLGVNHVIATRLAVKAASVAGAGAETDDPAGGAAPLRAGEGAAHQAVRGRAPPRSRRLICLCGSLYRCRDARPRRASDLRQPGRTAPERSGSARLAHRSLCVKGCCVDQRMD